MDSGTTVEVPAWDGVLPEKYKPGKWALRQGSGKDERRIGLRVPGAKSWKSAKFCGDPEVRGWGGWTGMVLLSSFRLLSPGDTGKVVELMNDLPTVRSGFRSLKNRF